MSKSVTNGHDLSLARDPSPHPDDVRRQLRQILASPVFHGSKRCQQFLEYVCLRSLAGEAAALKERRSVRIVPLEEIDDENVSKFQAGLLFLTTSASTGAPRVLMQQENDTLSAT